MAKRLTKIITRTGDDGTTGLADGSRLKKSDLRIHCSGEVDELNAVLGLLLAALNEKASQQLLMQIQHDLFDLGAELSQPDKQLLTPDYVEYLDLHGERLNAGLPDLKEFILPGGSDVLARIHLARTVTRRVERNLVALNDQQPVNPLSLQYINRLSDLFFILARFIAKTEDQAEIYWQSKYSRFQSS